MDCGSDFQGEPLLENVEFFPSSSFFSPMSIISTDLGSPRVKNDNTLEFPLHFFVALGAHELAKNQ